MLLFTRINNSCSVLNNEPTMNKKNRAKKKKADAMMMFDLLTLYTKISQDKLLKNIYSCFDDN